MELAPPKGPPLLVPARGHHSCWCSSISGTKFCTSSTKCADVCSKSCRHCWCRHSYLQKILAQILCEMVLLYFINLHVILLTSDVFWGLGQKIIEATETCVHNYCSVLMRTHGPWTTLVNFISSSLTVGPPSPRSFMIYHVIGVLKDPKSLPNIYRHS